MSTSHMCPRRVRHSLTLLQMKMLCHSVKRLKSPTWKKYQRFTIHDQWNDKENMPWLMSDLHNLKLSIKRTDVIFRSFQRRRGVGRPHLAQRGHLLLWGQSNTGISTAAHSAFPSLLASPAIHSTRRDTLKNVYITVIKRVFQRWFVLYQKQQAGKHYL